MLTSTGWWPREAGRWQHTGRWWLLKKLLRSRVHQRTRCRGGSEPRSAAPWTWAGSSWSTSGSSSITSRTTWWWWAADIRRWEAESGTRRTQDAEKPTGIRSQLLIFCKQKYFNVNKKNFQLYPMTSPALRDPRTTRNSSIFSMIRGEILCTSQLLNNQIATERWVNSSFSKLFTIKKQW